jgi:xanthine/uracil permease
METNHPSQGDALVEEIHPVDQIRPVGKLFMFAIQHILVMVAAPVSSVFLIAKALNLSEALSSALLSSVFVFCGLGSILQSVGIGKIGVRLPFIMLPGGAATILFISIAQGTDLQTAAGAVILTGIFYLLAVTLFVRILKYFPPLVIGTMVLVIGISLVKITGFLFTGRPGTEHFGDTHAAAARTGHHCVDGLVLQVPARLSTPAGRCVWPGGRHAFCHGAW